MNDQFKKDDINEIFSSVAEKYDIMNDIMSFGIHRIWKKQLISKISNLESRILDMSCGTGDIGLKIYQKAIVQKIVVFEKIRFKIVQFKRIFLPL